MPRVTFIADFDCPLPGGRAFISYKSGFSGLIPTAHSELAKKAGALDGDAKQGKASCKAGENTGEAEGQDQGSVTEER
jgi:hypothetical protein